MIKLSVYPLGNTFRLYLQRLVNFCTYPRWSVFQLDFNQRRIYYTCSLFYCIFLVASIYRTLQQFNRTHVWSRLFRLGNFCFCLMPLESIYKRSHSAFSLFFLHWIEMQKPIATFGIWEERLCSVNRLYYFVLFSFYLGNIATFGTAIGRFVSV